MKRIVKYILATYVFFLMLFMLSNYIPQTKAKYSSSIPDNLKLTITSPTYTIRFDSNGGTGTMSDMTNVKYINNYSLSPNLFTREDYTFTGWNTESNGSGTSYDDEETISKLADSGTVILYAQWMKDGDKPSITYHFGDFTFTGNNYLITDIPLFSTDYFDLTNEKYRDFEISFSLDSYDPFSGQQQNRNVIASCLDENNASFPGFDFRYLTDKQYFELESIARDGSITNKKRYDASSYPWNINIKRVDTNLYFNNEMNLDYTNLASNFNIPLTFGAEMKNANKEMYRFSVSSLSNIITKIKYENNTTITLPVPNTKGLEFVEWNTKPDGTGTSYTSYTITSNVDLYAIWYNPENAEKYSVTYDFGNISLSGNNYLNTDLSLFTSDMKNNNFEISTTMSNFEYITGQNGNKNTIVSQMNEADTSLYPGFVFRYESSSNIKMTINATSSEKKGLEHITSNTINIKRENKILNYDDELTADFTLFTKYFSTPLIFGAGIDKNGNPFRYSKGELNNLNITVEYNQGTSLTLPIPSIPNSSCSFMGWTGSNGSTPEKNVTIPSSNTTDKQYTANFECTGAIISFNANGGNVNPTTKTIPIGEPIGTLPTPTKTGYRFTGWYENSTSTTPIDSSYVPSGSITLIAKWEIKQYTITFNSDGGSAVDPITINYDATITLPANPTKQGYVFDRWSEKLPKKMPAKDINVTAEWKDENIKTYKVTYNYGNIEFAGNEYLDTDLPLFSSYYARKDFEISANLINLEFVPGQSDNFNSIISNMNESGSPYPGFVIRYKDNKYVLQANYNSSEKLNYGFIGTPTTFNLKRENEILSVVGTNSKLDFSYFNSTFNSPLTIGASLNGSNNPFRYYKGELDNITVSVGIDNDVSYTLPIPSRVNSNCTFNGWTGSNGTTPQTNVTIPADNTTDMTYTANFTCS